MDSVHPQKPRCYICQQRGTDWSVVYPTMFSLKRHLFSTHLHEKGFVLSCGIDGCPIEVPTRRALYSHVSKAHQGREWIPFASSNLVDNLHQSSSVNLDHETGIIRGEQRQGHQFDTSLANTFEESTQSSLNMAGTTMSHVLAITDRDHHPIEEIFDEDVSIFQEQRKVTNRHRQISTALSLIQLKVNYNLTQVAIEAVQEWAEDLLINTTKTLIGGVKFVNSGESGKLMFEDVFDLGEGMANPFQELKSEWNLKKLLRDQMDYVEPETVILYECVDDGLPGERKTHTMEYVPLIKILQLLYKDQRFKEELGKRKSSTSGELTDFLDGKYCRNHPLFSTHPDALQIQLYYDGFEVANPLGSKIQKHNIGALYFSILNLDPVYRSTLKSICLLGLFFENDVKHSEIGWDKILRRFNSDLKVLEEGIHINVGGREVFVQGSIAQCSLDNKAAHSIFGLQESFFGERSCISRYCHCTSADIQIKTSPRDCVLRDRNSFDDDLANIELTGQATNGVKTKCFIKSRFFHRGEAYAADIHHDVLEGLIPGMLKPILQELVIRKNLVTVTLLNGRIANFDYNAQDIKNKPSVITDAKLKEDSRSLKQYAAQYWCLLRKLPLILGDRIPNNDEHWMLLLQLVNVVDLIMAPKHDTGSIAFLEMELIVLFMEFRRLFPLVRITPKMHYTLHYPRLMKEVGPLIRHWAMRYEAKHHFFKRAATITGNYINVPHSLAVRHQMLQVVHVHKGGILNRDVVLDEGISMDVHDLPCARDISTLLKEDQVTVCDKVTVHGTKYSVGMCLITGFEAGGFVKLGEVTKIVASKTRTLCFVFRMLEVLEFSEHYHSWKIERAPTQTLYVALLDSLPDHQPIGVHKSFENSGALYANFKWSVQNFNEL